MYFTFDLDDTLLKSDKTISEYSKKVLKSCKLRGDVIVINTARAFEQAWEAVKEIEPDYLIIGGGAEIYEGDKLIYADLVPAEIVDKVTKEATENSEVIGITAVADYMYSCNIDFVKTREDARYFDFHESFDMDCTKILIGSTNHEWVVDLAQRYRLTLNRYYDGNWYRLNMTTKAKGQKKLYELLGDSEPVSAAFGDDTGDLEMLLEATYGVALKNSTESVLSQVSRITEYTNDEDGCCRYIEKNFL